MPNWKVHLEISRRLNKILNFNNLEQEQFNLGNILPDINNCFIVKDISQKLDHKYTHFQDDKETPSYENFKNIYNDQFYGEPLLIGYYTHLYTDYTWNNYFYTNFDNHEKLKNLSHIEKREIKQQDFKTYNNLFIKNSPNFTNKSELLKKVKKIDRVSITEEDIVKVEKFLKEQKKSNNKFQILSIEILDKLVEETIKQLEKQIQIYNTKI